MTIDSQTRIRFVGCSRKMRLKLHSRQSKFADQVNIAAKFSDFICRKVWGSNLIEASDDKVSRVPTRRRPITQKNIRLHLKKIANYYISLGPDLKTLELVSRNERKGTQATHWSVPFRIGPLLNRRAFGFCWFLSGNESISE